MGLKEVKALLDYYNPKCSWCENSYLECTCIGTKTEIEPENEFAKLKRKYMHE